MRKIKAALFDVDGTLLDTAEFIYRACEHTLALHKIPVISRAEMILLMGRPLEEWYHLLAPELDSELLCEEHRLFQIDNLHLSTPFPHAKETLHTLKSAAIKIAAITMRSKRTSLKTLEMAELLPYCDVVVSAEDTQRAKPDPEPLLKALQQLQVDPADAIMIGDSQTDVLAGKRAGTKTVGATYGAGASVAASDPDFLIGDIQKIIDLVLEARLDQEECSH